MYNKIAEVNKIYIFLLLPFHLNFLNLKLNNFMLQTSKNDDTNTSNISEEQFKKRSANRLFSEIITDCILQERAIKPSKKSKIRQINVKTKTY